MFSLPEIKTFRCVVTVKQRGRALPSSVPPHDEVVPCCLQERECERDCVRAFTHHWVLRANG
jgi:hypothetical protein